MALIRGLVRRGLGNNIGALRSTKNLIYTNGRYLSSSSSFNAEQKVQSEILSNVRLDRLYREILIELRAHQPDVLKSYSWFASTAAKELNIEVIENWAEPEPYMLRKTLLKSVFAVSKHRVQYEMRTYYHTIKVGKLTGSTADTYLEYIERNLPEGVAMKVTRHERRAGQNKVNPSS